MGDDGWTTVGQKPKRVGPPRPRPAATEPESDAYATSSYAGGGGGGSDRVVERKFASGGNKSAHSSTGANMRKLDEETETFNVQRVDRSFSVALQQARTQKGLTQKDLATRIAEKPSVINDYESGRAIPNPNIISKLDRALGTHLPRPSKRK